MIRIDGSQLEGGGALVRAALSMSVLTQQAVTIEGVRSGSRYPGVDVEDVTLAHTLAEICGAKVEGLDSTSPRLMFSPQHAPRPLRSAILSARSDSGRGCNAVTLATTLVPILARVGAMSGFEIHGETHGRGSMGFDYMTEILGPVWRKMNVFFEAGLEKASFTRDQTGVMTLAIEPGPPAGIRWPAPGEPRHLFGIISSSKVGEGVTNRMISHLQRVAQSAKRAIDIQHHLCESDAPGISLTIGHRFETGAVGASSSATRQIKSESLAQQVLDEVLGWALTASSLDPIAAEHVLIPAILAGGDTEFRVPVLTRRFLTIVWVMKQFVPIRITVQGLEGQPGHVKIRQATEST